MRPTESVDVVSEQELGDAFKNTNFGVTDHRVFLHSSVLKKALGYHCGHTITVIMQELRLIGKNGDVLKRGQVLLRTDHRLHEFMLKSG